MAELITASPMPTVLLSLSFSLMLRRPPAATLFPYTTLFRSLEPVVRVRPLERLALLVQQLLQAGDLVVLQRLEQDRKSTRLNSSHSQSSYAVFCLKIKSKHITLNATGGGFLTASTQFRHCAT